MKALLTACAIRLAGRQRCICRMVLLAEEGARHTGHSGCEQLACSINETVRLIFTAMRKNLDR